MTEILVVLGCIVAIVAVGGCILWAALRAFEEWL
jgi:hypothetical protein